VRPLNHLVKTQKCMIQIQDGVCQTDDVNNTATGQHQLLKQF